MFTGIVREIGEIKNKNSDRVEINAPEISKAAELGSSVCVSGVCLTVSRIEGDILYFDVMKETFKKTTLGNCVNGQFVNLESSLKAGDEIGGHFVYGHVDGVGEILRTGDVLEIKPPKELMKYIVPQGSIAVDGVSLTVSDFDKETFRVSLVPFTMENTTLGNLTVGDKVNIECDMLAKYIVNNL